MTAAWPAWLPCAVACLVVMWAAPASAFTATLNIAASPNSTVLSSPSFQLNITTVSATTCRFAVGPGAGSVPFAKMTPMAPGTASTLHTAAVVVSGDPLDVTDVAVRCAAWPTDPAVVLRYRVLSPATVPTSFPIVGNLWGSNNFRFSNHSVDVAKASRVSLWLGAAFTASELAALRAANNRTLALTSINAVDGNDGLPEHFYLHNVTGDTKADRAEVWPGGYCLDLTNPEVSSYLARVAYELFLVGGWEGHPARQNVTLPFDGIFTDNVFLSFNIKEDIYGRPFYPDTTHTGKPDNLTEFKAKWTAGVTRELYELRALLGPAAVMTGHALDPSVEAIADNYNGISIGFTTPDIIEGVRSFSEEIGVYKQWFAPPSAGGPRTPDITMIESAIPLQLGYGYGYGVEVQKNMPPSTFLFAQHYYRYMRFGVAYSLLQDGFVAHEVGDSAHGQPWWYDEYDVELGAATGPATPALPGTPDLSHAQLPWGGLGMPSSNWTLWADEKDGASATLAWDTVVTPPVTPPSSGSARVNITGSTHEPGCVELEHAIPSLTVGDTYELSFWVKVDSPAASRLGFVVDVRQDHPSWEAYGLNTRVTALPDWVQHNLTFQCTQPGAPRGQNLTDGRLQFNVGGVAPAVVWLDGVSLVRTVKHPPVLSRPFQHGMVVINADTVSHTVPVGAGYARFLGSQAPLHQYIVDDANTTAVSAPGWKFAELDSGYNMSRPSSEEATGPYYHHWHLGCRMSTPSSQPAVFDLQIPAVDTYNVSVWWANATASSAWSSAVNHTLSDGSGGVVGSRLLSQRLNGDQFHLVALNVELHPGAKLTVSCDTNALCVADAALVSSAKRFNDGSPAPSVTLDAMDAILLVKSDS